MRLFLSSLFLLLVGLAVPAFASDEPAAGYAPNVWVHIVATVSLSKQKVDVKVITRTDEKDFTWPVSTGRKGFETPLGTYGVLWADAEHHSSIYEDAPMPYSVFFTGGYAIHGTTDVRQLGHPVSHGCVRLDPANAKILFDYVNEIGKPNTRIIIAH